MPCSVQFPNTIKFDKTLTRIILSHQRYKR
jgi:hypothetical protein